MVTTLEKISDTQEGQTNWIIKDMLPEGHRGMIAACEGSCKTTLLAWVAVCVATGNRVFGMDVKQGTVLMIDEETPEQSLYKKLHRFCLHFNLEGRHELPELAVRCKRGFRFDRKNTELIEVIKEMQPALITIDTLIACLPSGRQGKGENNAETGIAVRENLNEILSVSPNTSILMAAHSGKPVMNFDLEGYKRAEMQALVRGMVP
jgi:RecA-family ATPase